jgi:hypothetical protein
MKIKTKTKTLISQLKKICKYQTEWWWGMENESTETLTKTITTDVLYLYDDDNNRLWCGWVSPTTTDTDIDNMLNQLNTIKY